MNYDIDIVLPWVDGADPAWQAEKSRYSPQKDTDTKINRYRDWGILQYLFRGIDVFMPWVRTVHFVTWGHLPPWLNTEAKRLHIVRHSDYIPKEYLPTFNSNPIELNFHRIAGLADRFIFFNDDMFAISPVAEKDFFVNGLPLDCVTEVPMRFFENGINHIVGNDVLAVSRHFDKRAVIRANFSRWFCLRTPLAALKNLYMLPVGGFSSFLNPHIPYPYLKSTFEAVWKQEPALLDSVCRNKFRSNNDVNQWMMRYWQFASGQFVQGGSKLGKRYPIGINDDEIAAEFSYGRHKLICLNDEFTDVDFKKEQSFLCEQFEKILPDKSKFEK